MLVGTHNLINKIVTYWALLGGFFLSLVVLVNGYSIIMGTLFNAPFSGDFELTEMGVAIAVFCFLPYVQFHKGHVSADIFTIKASTSSIRIMNLFAAIIGITIATILLWRMTLGLDDYITYADVTGVLAIPIWWAFIIVILSLLLLLITSLFSLYQEFCQKNG